MWRTKLSKVSKQIDDPKGELAQARSTEEAAKSSAKDALAALNAHDATLAANAEKLGRLRVQVEASDAEVDRLSRVAEQAVASIAIAEEALAAAVAAHDKFASQERPEFDLSNRQTLSEKR